TPALIALLKDKEQGVRQQAINALQNVPGEAKTMIPALTPFLKDPNPEVRQGIPYILARLGNDALPALTEALKDKDADYRQHVVWALQQMNADAKTLKPILTPLLKDENVGVRQNALQVLGRFGAEVLPELQEGLKDKEPGVRW